MNVVDRLAGIAGDVFAAAGATICRKKDVRMCIRWGGPFITTAEAVNRLRTAYALVYEASYIAANRKRILILTAAIACKRTRTVQPSRAGQYSDRNSIATEARESRLW